MYARRDYFISFAVAMSSLPGDHCLARLILSNQSENYVSTLVEFHTCIVDSEEREKDSRINLSYSISQGAARKGLHLCCLTPSQWQLEQADSWSYIEHSDRECVAWGLIYVCMHSGSTMLFFFFVVRSHLHVWLVVLSRLIAWAHNFIKWAFINTVTAQESLLRQTHKRGML